MTDDELKHLLMIIGGAAIGRILGKKHDSAFLGMLAGGAAAAVLGPMVIRPSSKGSTDN